MGAKILDIIHIDKVESLFHSLFTFNCCHGESMYAKSHKRTERIFFGDPKEW